VKKNLKIILLSLVGLAILGTTILVLQLTAPKEIVHESQPPEVGETSVAYIALPVESVVSIHIINQKDDGYTILGNRSIEEINERTTARIPYNEQALLSAAKAVSTLSVRSLVESNAQDLDKYGLSENRFIAKIETEYSDGNFIAFLIGDPAPDGESHYFRMKDEHPEYENHEYRVYTVATHTINILFSERHDFIERQAFPNYDANASTTIDRITIERTDLDEPIIIEALPELPLEELRTFNSHRMTSPFSIDADPEKATSIIFGLFGMTATKVLWVAPDEVDFELTELNSPRCTVEIIAGNEVLTLTIGGDFQGGVYGISSYVPELLFLFDPSSLPWLTVNATDLISETFLTPYIHSLSSLEIVTTEDTLVFDINEYSDDERFRGLYQFIISARGEQLSSGKPPGHFIARITYNYIDEQRTPDVVEFFEEDNRRSLIVINGKPLFTCRDIYTTRLLENIKAFKEGRDIINDW
jgi:hypothetical protein